MRLFDVVFRFDGDPNRSVEFSYHHNKPKFVRVMHGVRVLLLRENADGRYKACVTHAIDLVREVEDKPPSSKFARARRAASAKKRPALKIAGEE